MHPLLGVRIPLFLNLLIYFMKNPVKLSLRTLFAFFIVSVFCVLQSHEASAQRNIRDSLVFTPHISFNYAFQMPAGDLENRFGNNSNVGLSFHIKTKTNWYFGAEWSYMFGKSVNEEGLMQNLITDEGFIVDNEGGLARILIQERGSLTTLNVGKVIPLRFSNVNSGLLFKAGVGLMQHRIRIESQENVITQLEDEYLKGYDRLTNGLVLSQFLGYFHMSDNRLTNLYGGIEFYEGFTQGRRDYNFDTRDVDNEPRMDILFGIRVGWVIHIYKRTGREVYYD